MKKLLALAFTLLAAPAFAVYDPPIGIPAPPFGIDEVAPAQNCYVDKDAVGATDTANPMGSPGTPRLTVPTSLPAGTSCEVHGDNYTVGSNLTWASSGTALSPVHIKGVGSPTFTGSQGRLRITGSYIIVDGLEVVSAHVTFGSTTASVDHAAIRNMNIHGWPDTSTTSVVNTEPVTAGSIGASFIVIYNNEIHDNGDYLTGADDVHAIHISGSQFATDVWILNNTAYHNEGDSLQIGSATATEPWPIRIYVGGNTFHTDRENAVDLKQARDVIISQNTFYEYVQSATSSGECVVVHNTPERVWVMYNTISDCRSGIIGTGQTDFYIIGNVVYDVEHGALDTDYDETLLQTGGSAIQVRGGSLGDTWIVNNTVTDSDRGIYVQNNQTALVVNNIIHSLKGAGAALGFENSGANTNSTPEDNLFDTDGSDCKVQVSTTRYTTVAAYIAAHPSKCSGCIQGDPVWTNAGTRDYTIGTTSAAKDVGAADHVAYSTYESTYGESIEFDRAGVARPQDDGWDMGAYEFDGEDPPPPPTAARSQRMIWRRRVN